MTTRRPTRARAAHTPGKMNKLETAYAAHLQARLMAGEIREWAFEPCSFKVGSDRCSYTPDFRVITLDDTLEFHEVKGHWEDDARVKIKAAALQHPHIFIAVTRERGQWQFEHFNK